MKKLIALLLALMMPLGAAAEAYFLSISVDTDDELFPWYMKESLLMAPDAIEAQEVEVAVRLMQAILDDLKIDIQVQPELMSLEISVGRKPLLDMTAIADGQAAYITSSLFPGCVLTSTGAKSTLVQGLDDAFASNDWHAHKEGAHKTVADWVESLDPTVSTGVFTGDAYEGGAVCKTWTFSDQDIAGVLNTALTAEFRAALSEVLNILDIDAAAVFEQFQTLNDKVADEDAHLYILRVVENADSEFCGMSLTILREMQQIATASFGTTAKGVKLVIGLGLPRDNYWWEFTANQRQRNNMTTLSGGSREWLSAKELDFSYVSEKVAPVSDFDWHCYITKSGKRYLWDASIYEDVDQAGYRYLMSSDGKVNMSNNELDFTIALGDSPYIPASVNVKLMPAEAKTFSLDGLKRVSNAPETAEYQELLQKVTAMLSARLLKILPADLFVMLMQMNLME